MLNALDATVLTRYEVSLGNDRSSVPSVQRQKGATQTLGFLLQSGQLTPIHLLVEEVFHRAAPGGMGAVKAAGNYSPVCQPEVLQHWKARLKDQTEPWSSLF